MQANWARAAASKVISFTGMRTILKQLIPAFEQPSGHKITISYDASNIILGRIKNGESADLIILTAPGAARVYPAGRMNPVRCCKYATNLFYFAPPKTFATHRA